MDNKYCPGCSKDLPKDCFGTNKSKDDGLATYCRLCKKAIDREYYLATPEKNESRRAFVEVARKRNKDFIYQYLLDHPCVDCSEDDLVVLDFDHVSGKKEHNISYLVCGGFSLERIKTEITKCEVRCSNCHRKITAKRGNWSKLHFIGIE